MNILQAALRVIGWRDAQKILDRTVPGARQIGDRQIPDAGFRAKRVQAITHLAEERAAHGLRGALQQLIFLGADAGELDFAFPFER